MSSLLEQSTAQMLAQQQSQQGQQKPVHIAAAGAVAFGVNLADTDHLKNLSANGIIKSDQPVIKWGGDKKVAWAERIKEEGNKYLNALKNPTSGGAGGGGGSGGGEGGGGTATGSSSGSSAPVSSGGGGGGGGGSYASSGGGGGAAMGGASDVTLSASIGSLTTGQSFESLLSNSSVNVAAMSQHISAAPIAPSEPMMPSGPSQISIAQLDNEGPAIGGGRFA